MNFKTPEIEQKKSFCFRLLFRLCLYFDLNDDTYQQSHVIQRETLEDIGEAWLEVHGLLIEDEHTQQVTWSWCLQIQVFNNDNNSFNANMLASLIACLWFIFRWCLKLRDKMMVNINVMRELRRLLKKKIKSKQWLALILWDYIYNYSDELRVNWTGTRWK